MASKSLRQRNLKGKARRDNGKKPSHSHAPTRGQRFKSLLQNSLFLLVFGPLGLTVLAALFVTSPIDPEAFSLPNPPEFKGALKQNEDLASAERLYEERLAGPESIVVKDGIIYTGTMDGKILELSRGEIRHIASIGSLPCGRYEDEPTCGRPLGMRFDKDGYLIVADAYLGLYKINVATGDVHTLFRSRVKVGGRRPRFLNDLDIASNGTIYITDSSTTWGRRENRYLILENKPDGRLLRYDVASNTTTLLADGFYFPNGVQLSKNEDFLLFSETSRCRILRYHLKGDKAGTTDIFADNLPGLPDNIRRSSRGGFWVGLAFVRRPEFSIYDYTADKPWMRAFITKIFSQETILKLLSLRGSYGLIVELDQSGKIIQSLHDPTGQVIPDVSEVEDDAGTLYFGSYHSNFIGKYTRPIKP